MFGIIKKLFMGLLISIVNASKHTDCVSLSNQKCKIQPRLNARFNMIIEINESKTLTNHVSGEYKYKLDGKKYNSNQWWNNNKCRCECKKYSICEKDYVWNPSACNCENGKYLASIMDDSVITCDEIINAEETNFDEKI